MYKKSKIFYKKLNIQNMLIKFIFFFIYNSFCFIPNVKHYLSKRLKNDNILLLTDKGFLLYDPTLTNGTIIKSETFSFLQDSQIKHFSDEDGGYIIIFQKDIFYFFSAFGEYLQKYSISLNIDREFHSIVPYGHMNNDYYFYSIYTSSNSVYYKKYNYNCILNAIQYISQNNIEFQYISGSYISCHLLNYLEKKSIICSIPQYINSIYYINITIFDSEDNFKILKTTFYSDNKNTNYVNLNSALMKKENCQKI